MFELQKAEEEQVIHPALPKYAYLPINRCNLPAVILGSLSFQKHPTPLFLDGVHTLHRAFFKSLEAVNDKIQRAIYFSDYMRAFFLLDHLEQAGLEIKRRGRNKADYLRMLRGWLFDSDGREAAVLKSWVESRFGLLTRCHKGLLTDFNSQYYQEFLADRSQGLYNTNALEAQLDLLYSYCQYETQYQYPQQRYLRLYRGINRLDSHDILGQINKRCYILLFNNLNSFTHDKERADEFGDYILEVQVPLAKLIFMPNLLPGMLKGEEEYLVIGGLYQVDCYLF